MGFLALLSGRLATVSANSGDLFVTPDGDGDCSQTDSCDLQTAITAVSDGDIVYLTEGTYTGSGDVVIDLIHSITIFGGWDGTTAMPPIRDSDTHPTTEDGQGARRGVFIHSGTTVTLDGLRIT